MFIHSTWAHSRENSSASLLFAVCRRKLATLKYLHSDSWVLQSHGLMKHQSKNICVVVFSLVIQFTQWIFAALVKAWFIDGEKGRLLTEQQEKVQKIWLMC